MQIGEEVVRVAEYSRGSRQGLRRFQALPQGGVLSDRMDQLDDVFRRESHRPRAEAVRKQLHHPRVESVQQLPEIAGRCGSSVHYFCEEILSERIQVVR